MTKFNKLNLNIEFLRIIAMISICFVHVNFSVYSIQVPYTLMYFVSWLFEIVFIHGVNIFGMISGFVGINKHNNLRGIIRLYIVVLFYSIVGLFTCYFFFKSYWTSSFILGSVLPILKNTYWYISSYVALYIVAPILNSFLEKVNHTKSLSILFFLLFIVFYSSFNDLYGFGWGYCTAWLIVLYLVGALIRESLNKFRLASGFALFFIGTFFVYLSKIYSLYNGNISFIDSRLLNYSNFFITIGSIGLFIVGLKLKLKNRALICSISQCCLGIYIIQCHPIFWNEVIVNFHLLFENHGCGYYVLVLIASGLLMFLTLAIVEHLRIKLFGIFGKLKNSSII